MKNVIVFVISFLVVCAAVPMAGSIIDTHALNRGYWINLGVGSGIIHSFSRLSSTISLNFKFDHSLLTLRVLGLSRPFSDSMYGNASDISLLYGRILTDPGRKILLSASFGLGITTVQAPYNNETTIGFPLEVQAFPLPFLGVCGFANLNFNESFFGWSLCLRIGKK